MVTKNRRGVGVGYSRSFIRIDTKQIMMMILLTFVVLISYISTHRYVHAFHANNKVYTTRSTKSLDVRYDYSRHLHNIQQKQRHAPFRWLLSSQSLSSSSSTDITTTTSTNRRPNNNNKSLLSFNQQCLMDRITRTVPPPPPQTTSTSNNDDDDDTSSKTNETSFLQTWVPMCSVYELDGSRPNSIYFFGQEYIVYQKQQPQQSSQQPTTTTNDTTIEDPITQGWCVIDPSCSHRLAPLREGRIIPSTQSIQCSYHGWVFDGRTGNCIDIPQLLTDPINNTTGSAVRTNQQRKERIINNNPNCSIKSYPCMVEKNILWAWLWPTFSSSSNDENNNNDNALMYTHLPEYYLEHIPEQTTTFTRLLPYSYDILIENIMDISHVPFAHHTLQGTRDDVTTIKPIIEKDIRPLLLPSSPLVQTNTASHTTATTKPDDMKNGFVFHFQDMTRQLQRIGTCTFKAPYMVHYAAEYISPTNVTSTVTSSEFKPKTFNLTTLLIPVSEGWSKIIIYGFSAASTPKTTNNTTTSQTNPDISGAGNTTAMTTDSAKQLATTALASPDTKRNKKKTMQQRLLPLIFKLFPVWFLHTFSNRFLDSDLLLLHDQEIALQERQRHNNKFMRTLPNDTVSSSSSSILEHYFMPSKADRSVVAIRKWIRQYASSVYTLSSPSRNDNHQTSSLSTIAPYLNRPILFDRYHQHTKQCKYCNTMLESTLPRYKKYSYAALTIGIVFLQQHFIFKLLCIGSILSFPIYHLIDQSLRYGDFDHSKNH